MTQVFELSSCLWFSLNSAWFTSWLCYAGLKAFCFNCNVSAHVLAWFRTYSHNCVAFAFWCLTALEDITMLPDWSLRLLFCAGPLPPWWLSRYATGCATCHSAYYLLGILTKYVPTEFLPKHLCRLYTI